MSAYLMKTWVMVLMALSILVVSLALSLVWREAEWVARAGSLVAVIGLVLILKNNLLCVTDRTEAALIEKLHYRSPVPEPGTAR